MQISTTPIPQTKSPKGFTLLEVIIAIGIVSLLLTGFLGLYGTAQKSITHSLSVKESNQLRECLEKELATLRPKEKNEKGDYTSAFHKAFEMIKSSDDPSKAVLVYQYNAKTVDNDDDGILPPFTDKDGIPGRDFLAQVAVRRRGASINSIAVEDFIKKELQSSVAVGAVYAVKMIQMLRNPNTGALEISNKPGKILNPDDNSEATNASDYHDTTILFQAQFYRLPTNNPSYVNSSNWDFQKLGNPVSVINMAVTR